MRQPFVHYTLSLAAIAGAIAMPALPLLAQRVPPLPPVAETPYTLGAGDLLRIDIFDVPEYSGEYVVAVDGTLNLPTLGIVRVEGLTVLQAQEVLSGRYAPFLVRPIITVTLLTPRPVQVAISGEVNLPGSYTFAAAEGRQFPTITQAIETAGGITQAAEVQRVVIRRSLSGQPTITVDLEALWREGSLSQDITLRDGDTIFIPTASSIDPERSRQLASVSFTPESSRPVQVIVVGEVARPGLYTVSNQTNTGSNNQQRTQTPPTVTRVLETAGGVTPLANIRQVEIRRVTRLGIQTIAVDLWQFLDTGDIRQDPIVQEGDTVIVPLATDIRPGETQRLAAATFGPRAIQPLRISIVGEVFRPGSYSITPEENGKLPTLTRAIEQAGGITLLADIRSIEVRRVARDGTASLLEVDLWQLVEAGDASQDVLLHEGDTIVVPTATAVNPQEAETLASASFSPVAIRVNVVGEVENPGMVEVPPNTPLNQALLAAGGFDPRRARRSSVDLIRLNPDGTVSRRRVEVDINSGIDEDSNPALRNNDIIVVRRSGLTSFSDTISEALRPAGSFFSIFNFFRIFTGD